MMKSDSQSRTREKKHTLKSSHSARSARNATDDTEGNLFTRQKRKRTVTPPQTEELCGSVDDAFSKKSRNDHTSAGKIKITHHTSDFGDTDTFAGMFDDLIPVIIKKVPVVNPGFQESLGLYRLAEHNNIVRIYGVESDTRYIYTAYEQCSYTFQDYLTTRDIPTPEVLYLFKQVVTGLDYLSKKGIVHDELTLKDIWVKNDCGVKTAKIAGVGRQVGQGESANFDMRKLGLMLLASMKHQMRLHQSRDNKSVLEELLTKQLEAYDLISKLLNYETHEQLTYSLIYHHPLFWTSETRLRFLVDFCEFLKEIHRRDKNSDILKKVNRLKVFTRTWDKMVNKKWYDLMTRPKTPELESKYSREVFGFLKMVRNTDRHLLEVEWEEWDQEKMEKEITGICPTLAMEIYIILEAYHSKNIFFEEFILCELNEDK